MKEKEIVWQAVPTKALETIADRLGEVGLVTKGVLHTSLQQNLEHQIIMIRYVIEQASAYNEAAGLPS